MIAPMDAIALTAARAPRRLRFVTTARTRRRHRPDPVEHAIVVCRACGRPWPCYATRLLVELARLTADGDNETPEGTSGP